jgi:hypothetical protein
MTTTVTRDVPYLGRERNVRLSNGDVELVVPTEYGPRVMRYAKVGGENVLREVSMDEQSYDTALGRWHIRGGHRLWYAPESDPGSYHPDDAPVAIEVEGARVTVVQDVEAHSHLQKSITVELAPEGSHVRLQHRLVNRGASPVQLAPSTSIATGASSG